MSGCEFSVASVDGPVSVTCDAEDRARLARFAWRYQAQRGVVTRDGGTQMQATSLLCGWAQVRFINGDRRDLRRANLGRLLERGTKPKCLPIWVREGLWRVQRYVGAARLQICFSNYAVACKAGAVLREMSKAGVVAAAQRRRDKALARVVERSGGAIVEGFFDGRADMAGCALGFDDYAMMSHAVGE